MQPYPFHSFDVRKALYKFADALAAVYVNAVIGQVLSYYYQLTNTLTYKPFGLTYKFFYLPRLVLTRNQRYCAV